jgi:hypothetical protein
MFFCSSCGLWIAETALSKVLGVEAGKLEHRLQHDHPQLSTALSVAAPIGIALFVAWATPKVVRALKT